MLEHFSLFCVFIGAADPTYLKEPTDKIIFGVMVGMTLVGTANIMSGLYSMSFGVNKVA